MTRVPESTQEEMEAAVESALKAYSTWSKTSVLTRQQIMFKYQSIIKQNMKKLVESIVLEQGKTTVDAEGDILRGLRRFEITIFNNMNILKY